MRAVEKEMEFVAVPQDCFDMGSPDGEAGRFDNEGPVHQVCPKAFELGKFEVTQGQWRRVMMFLSFRYDPPSSFKGDERRPVEQVSWDDAHIFIRVMSFFGRYHYRLPSEAEWEYAARAKTQTPWYWGPRGEDGCASENMAGCDKSAGKTTPVGSFEKPNPFGLHDMLGNVMEWVEDCYVAPYPNDAPKDGSAVTIQDCATRVVRGGSWGNDPRGARAANAATSRRATASTLLGFGSPGLLPLEPSPLSLLKSVGAEGDAWRCGSAPTTVSHERNS